MRSTQQILENWIIWWFTWQMSLYKRDQMTIMIKLVENGQLKISDFT